MPFGISVKCFCGMLCSFIMHIPVSLTCLSIVYHSDQTFFFGSRKGDLIAQNAAST
jgi:hypothetical protein